MSLVFDGTDDKASVGIATGSSPPITMAAWAKLGNIANNAGGDVLMTLGQNNFVNHHHRLQVGNGTIACAVAHTRSTVGGATQESQTTTHVTDTTTWHHFAGVWAGVASRFAFLDGSAGPESTANTTLNTSLLNTVQLGLRTDNGQDYQGKLSHAAIWIGAALSSTEIAELAAGANPLDYYPGNLWGYWPGSLIDISGTNYLEDVSGNGRHMTLAGNTTYDADAPTVDPPSGGGDVTAPEVTGVSLSAGSDGNRATVNFTTDEGDGVAVLVQTTSATKPTDVQVLAGLDHTGAAALRQYAMVISSSGAKSFSDMFVPFGTGRYFHLVHVDSDDNASDVHTVGPFDTEYIQLFFDNFNRANGGLGVNWDDYYGSPAIAGNRVEQGTLDAFGDSASQVSSAAIEAVPLELIVELSTSAVDDPAFEDSTSVSFGTTYSGSFVGFVVFFGYDYCSLWWWDDLLDSYTNLDEGVITDPQSTARKRLEVSVVDGDVSLHIHSMYDDALLLNATILAENIPASVTEWRPGLDFHNINDTGTLWIDDFGVYGLPRQTAATLFFANLF